MLDVVTFSGIKCKLMFNDKSQSCTEGVGLFLLTTWSNTSVNFTLRSGELYSRTLIFFNNGSDSGDADGSMLLQ